MFTWIRKRKVPPSKAQEEFVRILVKRYSSGNISLNMGRYITESMIQERKKTISKIRFALK